VKDDAAEFVTQIDALVAAVERHMARWTTWLHLLQVAMLAFAVIGAAVLLYMGYLFVLEPVGRLKTAIERIQGGDLGARVDRVTSDEFGTLAEGFNGMAAHLQAMYRDLEAKVVEKTAQLEEKRERLEALYDVTALVADASNLVALAEGFAERVRRVARADGIAVRWSDEANERYLMLANAGLPAAMVAGERCLHSGACHCGTSAPKEGARVIPIRGARAPSLAHCTEAGFETLVSIPIRLHQRLMGEVDLFFHAQVTQSPAERSLLESLTAHLAGAMENLRLNALEKEAAVAQERTFLARELHDSIAQSLAFLRIQVQLLRDALGCNDVRRIEEVLREIDTGLRESYGDVRELLVHFRTRANMEDIEPALKTTLRKFEHQSGLKAIMRMHGHGMPLEPDLQIQVLHIVQEALSNVRKHARASTVWLDVAQQPRWRFEIRDDGSGFADGPPADEMHVGLRIMAERADRIGAAIDVSSRPGHGTSVVLTLAAADRRVAAAAPGQAPANADGDLAAAH
jgi:two-component system nitrate/nitrite sensor histidine kinase NarX